MKKDNENKEQRKTDHTVETPAPPQVMDPSTHPPKKEMKDQDKPGKPGTAPEKKKKPGEEKLAPAEEL